MSVHVRYIPVGETVCPHCWSFDYYDFIPEMERKEIELRCAQCGTVYKEICFYDHDQEIEEI